MNKFILNYEFYFKELTKIDKESFFEENKRIFVSGNIGAGLTSISEYIREKFGLKIINLVEICIEKKLEFMRE